MPSETHVQGLIRLEAARRQGWRLDRNNVGACQDKTGRVIRYGLANDSKKLNEVLKSADLIGVRPVLITPGMVGSTIGQYASVEVKSPDGATDPARRQAQENWRKLIESLGGYAVIVDNPEDIRW